MWLVLLYLAAIVAANLSVAYFGPASTIVNAFLFIGLDITTRDMLHERWENKNFWLRMGSLIAVGAALSWLLASDNVIVIPKTGNRERLRENLAAVETRLTFAQLAELDQLFPPPKGPRALEML